jgi:multiple sugar transport system permease protein
MPWLEVQPFAWVSILIATIWWTIGFNMIMFINAINEIDPFLYEAAALDGAGEFHRLIHIILPGIKNVTFFILMNTIIASFNLYGQCMLMTKGGPGQSTQTIIMAINNVIFDKNDLGKGTAMALLTGMVMMAVSLLQFFFSREKKELKTI